jgi:hypothetical protein
MVGDTPISRLGGNQERSSDGTGTQQKQPEEPETEGKKVKVG